MAMSNKATLKSRHRSASMLKKTAGKRRNESKNPSQKSYKNKLVMCRDFLWFGSVSLAVGAIFFFVTFVTTMTLIRFFIAAFFLIIGFIDLVLYIFFRER